MFNFVDFLRKKWVEYSESSGQKGTTVDEIAVKPSGLVLGDFYNSLAMQRAVNDISNWKTMTDQEMDFFGNKFFIPRVDGSRAGGTIRIYFDEKKDININADFKAKSGSAYLYQPLMTTLISRNSFLNSTDSSAKYYVDVLVTAVAAGNNYNIGAGEIVSLVNATFTYKRVTNLLKFSGGSNRETNTEYYNRLIYAINDRSMMNKKSSFSILRQYFPYINAMYIAAPGDKYMKRDLVQARDISIPVRESKFLGKIVGDNSVNNSAYYGTYPPEAGTEQAGFFGPFSIYSSYSLPPTVEAVDLTSDEVGLHGYPLTQEATTRMYQGVYFDDYKNFMSVSTSDLFNILNEGISATTAITSPNSDWIIGANGKQNGDYATLQSTLGKRDIVNFKNNAITLAAGSSGYMTASKDILKRTGVKLSGTFTTPSSTTSYQGGLQMMVGGVNSDFVDAFSGIGFGFRINSELSDDPEVTNAVVYFAHSERYGSAQIFASKDDWIQTVPGSGYVSVASMNSLAEKAVRLKPGSEYEFEFVINDNLSLSLYIKRVGDVGNTDNDAMIPWLLSESMLSVFSQEINKINTTHYGTMMKVSLDTKSIVNADKWVVKDLKAFDVAQHRAHALFIFDVGSLEVPLSVVMKASGSGSVKGAVSSGYSTYIWDIEQESPAGGTTSLSVGGWTALDKVSNPSGLKDSVSTNLTQQLNNIDQYVVDSRYGKVIVILVATTGVSEAMMRANNEMSDDIQSALEVDFIKIESSITNTYHANNKSDVYVSTIKNSESPDIVTTTIEKASSESFFLLNTANGFQMPIAEILTVSSNVSGTTEALAEGTYKVIRSDAANLNSNRETIYLSVDSSRTNSITVEYTSYKSVSSIQDFYESSQYSKVFGDVLVKHKFPCYLDIEVRYTGSSTQQEVIDAVKQYTDDNIDGIFSNTDLVSYLYNQNIVNNVQIPLTVSYTMYNDEMNVVSGSFTDSLKIRDIDFFRINNITASKL